MAARDHSHSHTDHQNHAKKVPLFPFVSLLCFVSMFIVLSFIRNTSIPSQSHQSIQFPKIEGSDPSNSPDSCNYLDGTWIHDPIGRSPRYDNTCKEIFKGWNCIYGNKSNARDLINWRWKPTQCQLPSFDPTTFLHTYRDTSIGTLFICLFIYRFVLQP